MARGRHKVSVEQLIDWQERRAKVPGKSRKERFVFFSLGVAEAMRRYWAEKRLPGWLLVHVFPSSRHRARSRVLSLSC